MKNKKKNSKFIFNIYRTKSSFIALPQNNIMNHNAKVDKNIKELVIQ